MIEVSRWSKFWSPKNILKGPFNSYHIKARYSTRIIPTMTFGSQTWSLIQKNTEKPRTIQNSIQRSTLNIKNKDHIKIFIIKKKMKFNTNAVRYIRRQKWTWVGHISRIKDDIWTNKSTFWLPMDHKRKKGCQPIRWRDDIIQFMGNKNYQTIATNKKE